MIKWNIQASNGWGWVYENWNSMFLQLEKYQHLIFENRKLKVCYDGDLNKRIKMIIIYPKNSISSKDIFLPFANVNIRKKIYFIFYIL